MRYLEAFSPNSDFRNFALRTESGAPKSFRRTMTRDLENEVALDQPGNAAVKRLTVGFDPWEAHELGGGQ
jgi:hypothetical protein